MTEAELHALVQAYLTDIENGHSVADFVGFEDDVKAIIKWALRLEAERNELRTAIIGSEERARGFSHQVIRDNAICHREDSEIVERGK